MTPFPPLVEGIEVVVAAATAVEEEEEEELTIGGKRCLKAIPIAGDDENEAGVFIRTRWGVERACVCATIALADGGGGGGACITGVGVADVAIIEEEGGPEEGATSMGVGDRAGCCCCCC